MRNNPETVTLRCLGIDGDPTLTDWSPAQKHCEVILNTPVSTFYMNRVEGTTWYAISSLETTAVPSNLYEFACDKIIGTHSRTEYVRTSTLSRTYYW